MDIFTGIALSLFFGITPMAAFAIVLERFDRYEKEPRALLLASFLWGAVIAAGAAFILNTTFGMGVYYLTGSQEITQDATAVIFGPLVEESVKGFALVLLFIFYRKHFNTLLDGIIYGSMIGFGFAATENFTYIFAGYVKTGLPGLLTTALLRTLLVPFMHATFTSLTGLGLAITRTRKGKIATIAPIAGYLMAVTFHATHNLLLTTQIPILQLASFIVDWTGVIALLILILILMNYESRIMAKQLREEIKLGNISDEQYRTAIRTYKKTIACWRCLNLEIRKKTARFYELLGRLAFAKEEEQREPDPENREAIKTMRKEIRELGAIVG